MAGKRKVCIGCGREGAVCDGPQSEFTINSRDESGRVTSWKPYCKECYRARNRTYYRANQEKMRADQRQRYREKMADPERHAKLRDDWAQTGRARRARDPEKVRAQARLASVRTRARRLLAAGDVEGALEMVVRARKRERARERQRRTTVPRGRGLPVAPFAEWLTGFMAATGAGVPQAADLLGIQERRVRAVLGSEQATIAMDVVDRALTEAFVVVAVGGREVLLLSDLYPDQFA